MEPWSTPEVTGLWVDEKLSKTTLISSREIVGRSLVEFPSHSNICENLKQLVMGTESNAFMISKKTAATWWVVERFHTSPW